MNDEYPCDHGEGLVTETHITPDGQARVVLGGDLNIHSAPECWNQLSRELASPRIKHLVVDTSGLHICDGAGQALLRYLNMGKMTPPASVALTGLTPHRQESVKLFTPEDYEAFRPQNRRTCHSLPNEVGNAAHQVGADLKEQIIFLGSVVAQLPSALINRRKMRWPEVWRVFELAGANGVPIISLISFL